MCFWPLQVKVDDSSEESGESSEETNHGSSTDSRGVYFSWFDLILNQRGCYMRVAMLIAWKHFWNCLDKINLWLLLKYAPLDSSEEVSTENSSEERTDAAKKVAPAHLPRVKLTNSGSNNIVSKVIKRFQVSRVMFVTNILYRL